jgi:hypothetical protein
MPRVLLLLQKLLVLLQKLLVLLQQLRPMLQRRERFGRHRVPAAAISTSRSVYDSAHGFACEPQCWHDAHTCAQGAGRAYSCIRSARSMADEACAAETSKVLVLSTCLLFVVVPPSAWPPSSA